MISDNFTNITTNPTITQIGCSFNNAMDGFFVFVILISLFFVMGFGIYSWNRRDFLGSFLYSSGFVTASSFFLTLAEATNCEQLLLFDQFIFFLVVTVLIFIGKKVID